MNLFCALSSSMLTSGILHCGPCLRKGGSGRRSPFEILLVFPDNGLCGRCFQFLQQIMRHLDLHHEVGLAECFAVLGASVSRMADLVACAPGTLQASGPAILWADLFVVAQETQPGVDSHFVEFECFYLATRNFFLFLGREQSSCLLVESLGSVLKNHRC